MLYIHLIFHEFLDPSTFSKNIVQEFELFLEWFNEYKHYIGLLNHM